MAVIASDTYTRTVASGWGNAEVGGAWSGDGVFATAANLSVDGSAGKTLLDAGGAGGVMSLPAVSATDTHAEVAYTITGGPGMGARFVGLFSRLVGGNDYEVAVEHRTAVNLVLWKNRSAVTVVTIPNIYTTWATGSTWHLKAEVVGVAPVTIRGKVWRDGDPEPGWQLVHSETPTGTHAGPGAVGIEAWRNVGTSGSTSIQFDNFKAADTATTAPAMYVGATPVTALYLGGALVTRA